MPKQVPFSVSHDDTRSLLRQVVDGLREAIVGGFYKPGEMVPSYRELAPMLGVSRIVTQAALRRIADEGLVVSRPRRGSFVRDLGAKQWLGHVVLVSSGCEDNYQQTVISAELRRKLIEIGYLFTHVDVPRKADGSYEFAYLDATFSRSVDLVVALYEKKEIFRYLSRRKVPYVAVSSASRPPDGAIGFTVCDYGAAVPSFAAECARRGIGEVVEVYWDRTMCDITPAFREAGMRVRRIKVDVDESHGVLAGVKNAGMRLGLSSKFKVQSSWFLVPVGEQANRKQPSNRQTVKPGTLLAAQPRRAYFFADDYLAAGALSALSYRGLKAPEDILVATCANKGLGIAYPRELSRMEFDPVGAGSAVADAVLAYLRDGAYPCATVSPVWIPGETLGK